MEGFITGLTAAEGGVTAANLWATVAVGAGLVATSVIFKFGYNFITGVINNFTKPKKKPVK